MGDGGASYIDTLTVSGSDIITFSRIIIYGFAIRSGWRPWLSDFLKRKANMSEHGHKSEHGHMFDHRHKSEHGQIVEHGQILKKWTHVWAWTHIWAWKECKQGYSEGKTCHFEIKRTVVRAINQTWDTAYTPSNFVLLIAA